MFQVHSLHHQRERQFANNLIKFMDEPPETEIIFEEDKNEETIQMHLNTPQITFPEEDLVDAPAP